MPYQGGLVLFRNIFIGLFLPALTLAQVSSYTINTVVGSNTATALGDGGPPLSAELNTPVGLSFDAAHNLYIADSAFNRIREVTGGKITTVAGNGTAAWAGDGGLATGANLSAPYKAVFDSSGNMYIADLANQVVRMVSKSTGNISTFAGQNCCYGFAGDGGAATGAVLNHPFGLAFDSSGNLYIADSNNQRIRMVTPGGTITTVAGNGNQGFAGDGGPATKAQLNEPFGIAFDPSGNLFIADSGNNRIRVLMTNGNIATVAGNGKNGYNGDGILATAAELNRPFDVAFDAYGNLFIADTNNFRVREVTTNGMISTIGGGTGEGYSGDGFIGTNAKLNSPSGLAVDSSGNIYISDSGNNVIRELTPYLPFVNPGGVLSASAFGGFTSVAPGSWIEIYGSNLSYSASARGPGRLHGRELNSPHDSRWSQRHHWRPTGIYRLRQRRADQRAGSFQRGNGPAGSNCEDRRRRNRRDLYGHGKCTATGNVCPARIQRRRDPVCGRAVLRWRLCDAAGRCCRLHIAAR